MMNEMFPLMQTMHHEEATTPTECQDLLGMSFRTVHFDGFGRVPSYLAWVTDCDMRSTYRYHRRVLRLLQWHCPPRLWHLKTPVHMFALDALVGGVSRRQVPVEPPRPGQGARLRLQPHPLRAQLGQRPRRFVGARGGAARALVEACRRAMDFRGRVGEDRFADLAFADLQGGSGRRRWLLPTSGSAIGFPDASREAVAGWATTTSRARTATTPTSWRSSASTPTRCTSASPATWRRTMPSA